MERDRYGYFSFIHCCDEFPHHPGNNHIEGQNTQQLNI